LQVLQWKVRVLGQARAKAAVLEVELVEESMVKLVRV
jgi:hypothetical protein